MEILADGRRSWNGWLELAKEPVDEVSTRMTARVIAEVAADVLCVVEAENRPSLDQFNTELLDGRYGHAMLIDGNDDRGIDVGLLTVEGVAIADMRSNVDVDDPANPREHLFSRDCPEFRCVLPSGEAVWVLATTSRVSPGVVGATSGRARPRAFGRSSTG